MAAGRRAQPASAAARPGDAADEPGRPGHGAGATGSSSCGSRTRSETGAAARSRSTPARSRTTATGTANPANDRDAYQRIFLDSNGDHVFDREQDTESERPPVRLRAVPPARTTTGTCSTSPATSWCAQQSGRTVARSTKIGFCIVDTDRRVRGPARLAAGAATTRRQRGLRPGLDRWASRSAGPTATTTGLPGQQLNVTGLKARALLPGLDRRSGQPAARVRQLEQRPQDPDRAAPGEAHGRALPGRCRERRLSRWQPAGCRLGLAGSPSRASPALPAQCASGEGGVSRRYHSASSAPMQPVPAAVTAWR